MVTLSAVPTSVLTEDLLARCAERAAAYDRENRFFTEDFEELRQAGDARSVQAARNVISAELRGGWGSQVSRAPGGAGRPRW